MIDSEPLSELPRQPFAEPVRLADVPRLEVEAFRQKVIDRVRAGCRISALFGDGQATGQTVRLYAVLADDAASAIDFVATDVGDRYRSLTPDCPQAHWFEREIAEQWGVVPTGHPWLKPIRFHRSYRPGKDAWNRPPDDPLLPGVTNYFHLDGDEVHEVAVGPVHAGVIEPGSFRFQCRGEHVFSLEISLGYQHRGIERALLAGPHKRTIHQMETVAGDTSIGHATAYCRVLECLSGCQPSLRAQALRGIALELERLANHTGDLGALAGDVAYLPTMAFLRPAARRLLEFHRVALRQPLRPHDGAPRRCHLGHRRPSRRADRSACRAGIDRRGRRGAHLMGRTVGAIAVRRNRPRLARGL